MIVRNIVRVFISNLFYCFQNPGTSNVNTVNISKRPVIISKERNHLDTTGTSEKLSIRFNKAGDMLVADYTGHNILKVDMQTKAISTYAHESRMNQPNDIALAPGGNLYASDPDWPNQKGQLWLITPDVQCLSFLLFRS